MKGQYEISGHSIQYPVNEHSTAHGLPLQPYNLPILFVRERHAPERRPLRVRTTAIREAILHLLPGFQKHPRLAHMELDSQLMALLYRATDIEIDAPTLTVDPPQNAEEGEGPNEAAELASNCDTMEGQDRDDEAETLSSAPGHDGVVLNLMERRSQGRSEIENIVRAVNAIAGTESEPLVNFFHYFIHFKCVVDVCL